MAFTAVVLSLVSVLVAATGQSHELPGFDGRWVLESVQPPDPDAPRALVVQQLIARTNVRGEPMPAFFQQLTVTRELSAGPKTETFVIGTTGGTVARDGKWPRTHHQVEWKDSTLVREEWTVHGPDPRNERTGIREVWKAGPEGRLHVSVVSTGADGTSTERSLVYRKGVV